jgi:hypothetical protein
MSAHPELEQLEELALGQGAAAAEHVAQCAECAREVAWLRAERLLMSRRPAPAVAHLWDGVQKRLGSGLQAPGSRLARRPHWARRVGIAAAAAAAAIALLVMRPKPVHVVTPVTVAAQPPREDDKVDPKALAALDRAETDYRDAAKVLETEYTRLRPRMDPKLAKRWDETLTRAHTELGEARAVAGEDVNARMQLLDGYAGYLRSLRSVVQSAEEANP